MSSRMRLTGLTSGMDVDSIVEKTLKVEKVKIDKVFQNKTLAEWKKDAYRDINTSLASFQSSYLSMISPKTNIISKTGFNAKTLSIKENSYIKVTTNSEAEIDSKSITGIKLAKNAYIGSEKVAVTGDKKVYDMTLDELAAATGKTLVKNDDGKITFNINGKPFEFGGSETIKNITNAVNSTKDINARMIFNEFNGKFEIKSTKTGTLSEVDVAGDDGLFFGTGSLFGVSAKTENGDNASIIIDGETLSFQSNIFEVGGLKFELLSNTTEKIDFSVTKDTDSVVNRIKSFIDEYNKLIEDLNSKLSETKFYGYPPLTDEQKEDMKENEITAWEKKAKSGLLAGDNKIRNLLGNLRSVFSETIPGINISFSEIGIKTSTWDQKGKIVIDEAKLKSAIETRGDEIAELFTKVSANSDPKLKYQESGLAYKFDLKIKDYIKFIKDNTIASFEASIKTYDDKMSYMNELLAKKEDTLYEQYSSLETVMSSMNNQSAWLFQQ